MERIRVEPVRVKLRDEDGGYDRLRGVGFRAVSSAGWRGPVRAIRQDAVEDAYARRAGITLPRAGTSGTIPA